MNKEDFTGLFGELSYIVRKSVPDLDSRREIYEHMIDSFNEIGWDCHPDDVRGSDPVLDDILEERYPEEAEEEEEDESYDDE